jgi:hypothetical protein
MTSLKPAEAAEADARFRRRPSPPPPGGADDGGRRCRPPPRSSSPPPSSHRIAAAFVALTAPPASSASPPDDDDDDDDDDDGTKNLAIRLSFGRIPSSRTVTAASAAVPSSGGEPGEDRNPVRRRSNAEKGEDVPPQ